MSTFKNFRFMRPFRSMSCRFCNIFTPNVNAPNFGGNVVTASGNSVTNLSSTFVKSDRPRDAPFGSRQIQFALKLYARLR